MKLSYKHWIPAFAGMTKKYLPAFAGMTLLFLFSFWLMFHTFSYNGNKHQMHIAFKLWSDFGAHIPMIRSFSMGDNLTRFFQGTVEYPIFPGEPIRYHYLFYLAVGALERIGLPIDWALNIPSALGFFFLLVLIYTVTIIFVRKRSVALLTLVFFFFNGTLGFVRFFELHPLSFHTLRDIWHAKDFPAFAPWGPGWVTAFWNLNIYTNQRHLALAFALVLLFLLTCYKLRRAALPKQLLFGALWGLVIGVFPYFHQPTLLILAIVMMTYFFVFPNIRGFLMTAGIIGLALSAPQILGMPPGSTKPFEWYPGYIIHNEVTLRGWIAHWIYNFGLHTALMPIGFFLIPRSAKRYFLPLIPLFIIPNLFKFSVEVSANHKFFNFIIIMGNMLSAYAIVWLADRVHTMVIRLPARHRFAQAIAGGFVCSLIGLLLIPLTLSGIIDLRVIMNDRLGVLDDIPANEVATWITHNTPPDAVFLNSQYLYHPASIVGRPVLLGWPYFPWSAGYTENRMPLLKIMYEDEDHALTCELFTQYRISYVTVQNVTDDDNLPRIDLATYLGKYTPVFLSASRQYAIFSTRDMCP